MASSSSPSARPGDGLSPFIVVKTVVGEVKPVFNDALALREEIFCGEQRVPRDREIDGLDAVAIHIVAYLNVTAQEHHRRQQELTEKLTANSGVSVRFQHRTAEEVDTARNGGSGSGSGGRQRYRPPTLEPVGALRMRRVSACSQLGKFNMMVGKLERVCVRKAFRRSGVGDVLLQAAERTATEAFHVPLLMMHAQVSSEKFYKKRGYAVWSKGFMDADMPHVVMVKNLTEAGGAKGKADTASPQGDGEVQKVKTSDIIAPSTTAIAKL